MAGQGISQKRETVLSGFVPATRDTAAPRGLAEQRAPAGEAQGGGSGLRLFPWGTWPLSLCLDPPGRRSSGRGALCFLPALRARGFPGSGLIVTGFSEGVPSARNIPDFKG